MKTVYYKNLMAILLVFSLTSAAFAGEKVEKKMEVAPFTRISLAGPYQVILHQGKTHGVIIKAEESLMKDIDVSSSGGELSIEYDHETLKTKKDIEVFINFENLEKIEVEGAVNINCDNQIVTKDLKLEFEGAGKVELDVKAEKIISEIDGVGSFYLSGTTDYHKVEFDGVGSYEAIDLISKFTKVESNGVGSVKVYASEKFIGEANGVGSVKYYGDPEDVDIESSGLGKVGPQ